MNDFPEILSPLAASLKYENAFMEKENNLDKMKNEILEKYPGETWRIEKIEKNKGMIQTLINMGNFKTKEEIRNK